MDWQVAGHKKQLEFLEQTIKRGRLAHAYVFAGPQGVGKRMVAHKLAQILICENNQACNSCKQCKSFVLKNNADFIELGGSEAIKIEQIRDLIYKLSLKPYLAQYKVAVIDAAENMTEEAQNALLKSIEEPKPYTIVILITSSPDRLKKTILSRAQKINFGVVDYDGYKYLLPLKLSTAQKALIQNFASQKPGLALKIAMDEEFLSMLANTEKQLDDFLSEDKSKRLLLVNQLSESETAELLLTLDLWQNRLESELRKNPHKKLADRIALLGESQSLVRQNLNAKLVLVNLMLQADYA
ncbi:MAG: AAA family ATPase [Candidatus Doudnabacteria bacterium]|nr:AAA family ATPase [Candidatus Doudnabacteria bacterium]